MHPPVGLREGRGDRDGTPELHTYDGADHMWRHTPEVTTDALDRTVAFLRRHLIDEGDRA
jgi:hypothetical protein